MTTSTSTGGYAALIVSPRVGNRPYLTFDPGERGQHAEFPWKIVTVDGEMLSGSRGEKVARERLERYHRIIDGACTFQSKVVRDWIVDCIARNREPPPEEVAAFMRPKARDLAWERHWRPEEESVYETWTANSPRGTYDIAHEWDEDEPAPDRFYWSIEIDDGRNSERGNGFTTAEEAQKAANDNWHAWFDGVLKDACGP